MKFGEPTSSSFIFSVRDTHARGGTLAMTSSTHIYGALIAGCAAGWCLRELWLRDAARREAEVRPIFTTHRSPNFRLVHIAPNE